MSEVNRLTSCEGCAARRADSAEESPAVKGSVGCPEQPKTQVRARPSIEECGRMWNTSGACAAGARSHGGVASERGSARQALGGCNECSSTEAGLLPTGSRRDEPRTLAQLYRAPVRKRPARVHGAALSHVRFRVQELGQALPCSVPVFGKPCAASQRRASVISGPIGVQSGKTRLPTVVPPCDRV